MNDHLSTNQDALRASLDRPCRLCGQPMGKHVAPPYGTKREEVGAMGLYCPTDPRLTEKPL